MTKGWKPGDPVPNVHDGVARMLAEAGYPDEAVPALLAFDVAQFQWYRMTVKGDMLRVILRRIGAGIEQAQFQALTAILRVEGGVGRAPAAATVGLVAEQMNVDPSRASRLLSELVARGLVQRRAAQEDGRRVVLELTPAGTRLMAEVRAEKWRILAEVFRGWTAEEVAAFAGSLNRYSVGIQEVLVRMDQEDAGGPG